MRTLEKLMNIARRAKAEPKTRFTSLAHLVDGEMLRWSHSRLKRNRAVGVDSVGVEAYGVNLGANVDALVGRLKDKSWRPKPVRRVHIPKPGKTELRPLGIPTTEDKLVQHAVKVILESIHEPDFLDCSHGFRPGRSAHTALKAVNELLGESAARYVVEVDIRKFFDNVSHYWLLRCLEEKILDESFLLIVRRLLKSGVMEGTTIEPTTAGTPQGGVVSPILANIYLHYVLDLWFERVFRRTSSSFMGMVRYCDDFVAVFESRKDAERFLRDLDVRLAKFGLECAQEKTRLLPFGVSAVRSARRKGMKAETFSFLGFTIYMGRSRKGFPVRKMKTEKTKIRRCLTGMSEYLRRARTRAFADWYPVFKSKLRGHLNYFGVSGNIRALRNVRHTATRLLFRWLNRRSQKKSQTWETFERLLERFPLPPARIVHRLYSTGVLS